MPGSPGQLRRAWWCGVLRCAAPEVRKAKTYLPVRYGDAAMEEVPAASRRRESHEPEEGARLGAHAS